MQNPEYPQKYHDFIDMLEDKGWEYRVFDEPQGAVITVLYMKPSEIVKNPDGEPMVYEKCREFKRPLFTETLRSRLEQAGFPKMHIDDVLKESTLKKSDVLTFCDDMLKNFPSSAVISGEPNLGKTLAAAWLAMRLFQQRKIVSAAYVRAAEVTKERSFSHEGSRWDFNFNRSADFLVLDDLGTESIVLSIRSENQDKQGLIQELVDFRLSEKLPTLITTNLDKQDLLDRYGSRLISRIDRWGTFKTFPSLPF
jgi:DNA replication protein DnaC